MQYSLQYYFGICLVFFICCLLFSLIINNILLKFSKNLGVKNTDEGTIIRWGTRSKPTLGGISFYITFLIAMVSYSVFFDVNQVLLNNKFVGVLLTTSLGFIIGFADDAYGTKPLLKFFGQILCGIILISSGIFINISPLTWLNYFITLFWVVGIMNSINMLDNMDGITATISLLIISAALTLIFLYRQFVNIHVFILLGTTASLISFLYFNWKPSKMYMGDTGSQFLGALLSAIGIIYFWNTHEFNGNLFPIKQLIIPVLIFIVPLVDTTSVFINRLLRKQSPFVGGKDHTTHHLAFWGFTEKQVVFVLGGLTVIAILLVIAIIKLEESTAYLITAISILYAAIVFVLIYSITRFDKSQKFLFKFKRTQYTNGDATENAIVQDYSSIETTKPQING